MNEISWLEIPAFFTSWVSCFFSAIYEENDCPPSSSESDFWLFSSSISVYSLSRSFGWFICIFSTEGFVFCLSSYFFSFIANFVNSFLPSTTSSIVSGFSTSLESDDYDT
jgi:hypothetical protein